MGGGAGALALVAILLAVLLAASCAEAHLSVRGEACKDHTCDKYMYCSDFDNHCRNCSEVCEPASLNADRGECEKGCQDYLHDLKYLQKTENVIESLTKKVQVLTIVSTVSLVLSGIILLCCMTYLLKRLHSHKHLLRKVIKNNKGQVGNNNNKEDVEIAENGFKGVGLKLNVSSGSADHLPPPTISRSVSHDAVTPATTSTPLSRPRHPSEDNTLEYAYDNPGLAPSPVPDKTGQLPMNGIPQRIESSF